MKHLKKQNTYKISSKFSVNHRVRQLDHQPRDLADVELPLYTRVYTNALSYGVQQNVNYEDSCLFKFWQESYIGTFFRDGKFSETFQVIVPNTEFKQMQDVTTIGSVLLAMLWTLWILFVAKDPERVVLAKKVKGN